MSKAVVLRIAVWAIVGFLISAGWGLYFANKNKALPIEPIVYTFASLSQPIIAAVSQLRIPVHLAWAIVLNGATYALLGLAVEMIRRHYRSDTTNAGG